MSLQFKYALRKGFEFHAAHSLKGAVPENHKCYKMHGHTYKGEVVLYSYDLDNHMVMDAGLIKSIIAPLDHANLDEVLGIPPTAENIARWIAEQILAVIFRMQLETVVRLDYVQLYETDGMCVTLRLEEV